MSWTLILILILVVAMLVGPIAMLRPTRRQRQLAELRQEAARMGLRVELQSLGGRSLAAYERRWPLTGGEKNPVKRGWALDRQTYEHDIHFHGLWHWRDENRAPVELHEALHQALAELPGTVQSVEATPVGLRCVWGESGGKAEIQAIADWLDRQIKRLWPLMPRAADRSS
jgi:hypothetical protein